MQNKSSFSFPSLVILLGAIQLHNFTTHLFALNSGKWIFMYYFDDQYNFVESLPELSFSPISFYQLKRIFSHVGLNVYEPIGSIVKASSLDILGTNPGHLRAVSLFIHHINSILLIHWLLLAFRKHIVTKDHHWFVLIVATALLYTTHPLHMEVIGWLSAQSYTLALTFSLLSSICLEEMLLLSPPPPYPRNALTENSASKLTTNQEQTAPIVLVGSHLNLQIWSVLFYCLACLSKAPAVMLPVVHTLRLLFCRHPALSATELQRVGLRHCGLMTLAAAGMVGVVRSANAGGTYNALVTFDQPSTKVIRAMVTVWNFLVRTVSPSDLRGHYVVEEEERYSLSSLWAENSPTLLPCALLLVSCLLVFACRRKLPMTAWSFFSLLACWAPCVGLINHGWALLGADRYCYLALAFACPGVVEIFGAVFFDEEDGREDGTHVPPPPPPFVWTARADRFIRQLSGCAVFAICFIVFRHKSIHQLETWRDDKAVLLNCIRHDPRDYECHQYLADWYGHHEKDEQLGMHHLSLSLSLLPSSEPKAQLFKAKTLVELDRQDEACEIYEELYSSIEEESELAVHPYIINNYVICHAIRHGITPSHLQTADSLLDRAIATAQSVSGLPDHVLEGLLLHKDVVRTYGSGRGYEVSLLY